MTHKETRLFTTRLLGVAASAALLLAIKPTPAQQKQPSGATLSVIVSGVHDRSGILRVNLYKSADGFPADTSKAYQKRDIVLKSLAPNTPLDPLRVSFTSLPPGT